MANLGQEEQSGASARLGVPRHSSVCVLVLAGLWMQVWSTGITGASSISGYHDLVVCYKKACLRWHGQC